MNTGWRGDFDIRKGRDHLKSTPVEQLRRCVWGWASRFAILRGDPDHKWDNNNQYTMITEELKWYTIGSLLEHPPQEFKETAPLGPTGYLLPKATLQRLGVIAGISNTEINTKREVKWGDKETTTKWKKMRNLQKKDLNEMEVSNLSDTEITGMLRNLVGTTKNVVGTTSTWQRT